MDVFRQVNEASDNELHQWMRDADEETTEIILEELELRENNWYKSYYLCDDPNCKEKHPLSRYTLRR